MTEYSNGTRVRAVVEGTVEEYSRTSRRIRVERDDGHAHYFKPEHLTVIEPGYEHGAYYRDANGVTYRLSITGERWLYVTVGGEVTSHPFDHPKRPLRKMVPENG